MKAIFGIVILFLCSAGVACLMQFNIQLFIDALMYFIIAIFGIGIYSLGIVRGVFKNKG